MAQTATDKSNTSDIHWSWPTDGKVVDSFSNLPGGNQGINIAGVRGQAVVAAADGNVVYVGNALTAYGNLIIIKHNNYYLSAYAYNDSVLVSEHQEIKAGQKIATMGASTEDSASAKLHFEIRYKGKAINPLSHLPQH